MSAPSQQMVCRFYGSNKGCRNGTSCPFLHADQAPTPGAEGQQLQNQTVVQKPAPTARQRLQKTCSALGWSYKFEHHDDGGWAVDVGTDVNNKRRFFAQDSSLTEEEKKEGEIAAASVAMAELEAVADRLLAQPSVTFDTLFDQKFSGRILESSAGAWEKLRASCTGVVGIDCEAIVPQCQ